MAMCECSHLRGSARFWDNGYERKCWLAAFEKGECRDAFEVATEAREDWKQYFLKMGEAACEDEARFGTGSDELSASFESPSPEHSTQ